MPKPILFSVKDRIGILRLNRPDVLNAIDQETYDMHTILSLVIDCDFYHNTISFSGSSY